MTQSGRQRGVTIIIENKQKFTIGLARDCDVVLADRSVSRHHAQLHFLDEGKLLLIDCHSAYGTAIRGTQDHFLPIHHELVSPTDTVRFGEATLARCNK
ncbi:MAG: FHA domain-containing protein [Pseudomonadota bacterium]